MDKNKCYLCEKLCFVDSSTYNACRYRKEKSFGDMENRAFEEACTQLAVKFGRKHGWRFEGWVGYFNPGTHNWCEGAGGWAQYDSDDVVAMDDLRADLLMDAPVGEYTRYMDAAVEEGYRAEAENRPPRYVNFRNWLLGARHDMNHSEEYLKMVNRRLAEENERLKRTRDELLEQLQKDADDLQAGSDGCY